MKKLILVIALAIVGCAGNGAGARQTTVSTSITVATAAHAAFMAFDATYEKEIATAGTSRADIDAKIAAYHSKRDALNLAFFAWFNAIDVVNRVGDDHSLAALAAEALHVEQLIAEIKGGKP